MNNTREYPPYRIFILMWIGSLINSIGTGLTLFSLSVYLFETTGSATITSFVTLAGMLPRIILLPYAGVLADKYNRRALMMIGDGISGLGVFIILLSFMQFNADIRLILLGLVISAIFSTLTFPAFKASISDILSEEDYMKSASLIQLNDVSGYLICPFLAGILLTIWPIEIIFVIDILTIFVTLISTLIVKKYALNNQQIDHDDSSYQIFKEGIKYLKEHKALLTLIIHMTLLTFFLGMMQCLITPLMLTMTNSKVLGICLSVAATGMMVMSLILGIKPIKSQYMNKLSLALSLTGIWMIGIGIVQNIRIMTAFAFCLFASLAVANSTLDYLIRMNVDNAYLGRVMGFAANISQIGYALSYLLAGILADYVFTPLLSSGNFLAIFLKNVWGSDTGRAMGLVIILAGTCMLISAYFFKKDPNLSSLRE